MKKLLIYFKSFFIKEKTHLTLDKIGPFQSWINKNNKLSHFHSWLDTQPYKTKSVYLELEKDGKEYWWCDGIRYKYLITQGIFPYEIVNY